MGNQASKVAAADLSSSSNPVSSTRRIELYTSSTPRSPNGKSALMLWQCTICRRQYVDTAASSIFMSPPPTTECMIVQTDETWTHPRGGFVNLSITGGATCDYVRVKHIVDGTGLREQIAEPEDAICATTIANESELLTQASSTLPMKIEGEHGRVNRLSRTMDSAFHQEEDEDDCEFWMGACKDVDCIYVGDHRRHQCAMGESDKEA